MNKNKNNILLLFICSDKVQSLSVKPREGFFGISDLIIIGLDPVWTSD